MAACVTAMKLAVNGLQQRLATDRQDGDAENTRHVLGQSRHLSRLQEVVEEQEVHSKEADD